MEQLDVYKNRIRKLLDLFKEYNPDWIKMEDWTDQMLEFELDDNFFLHFFVKISEEDFKMMDFQTAVITKWAEKQADEKKQSNEKERQKLVNQILSNTYLIGTEIDPNYLDGSMDEINLQQKSLDYVWWSCIKQIIYSDLDQSVKEKLDQKELELFEKLS